MFETARQKKLGNILKRKKTDALVVTNPSNLFYLTGFRAEGCMGLVYEGYMELFTPVMLYEQIKVVTAGAKVVNCGNDLLGALKKSIKNHGIKKLAFEQANISYKFYAELTGKLEGWSITAGDNIVESMREKKDDSEIKLIRKSAGICRNAFRHIEKLIKPGKSEKELAARMEWFIKGISGLDTSFDTIVASGANSAYPHHVPGDRKVRKEDVIIVDAGCKYKGYSSDLTRTFFLSNIHRLKYKKIVNALKNAQKEVINHIKPGASMKGLHNRAMKVIKSYGFADYFIHGLGHGVGIDVHEEPYINSRSIGVLKKGMVITVEPGVYIPGEGGVRLEDMVLVTSGGGKVL